LRHVPSENREHCSHIVVGSKHHFCEQHSFVCAYRRTEIHDLGYPSLIAEVGKAVELVLQIRQCNIIVDPHLIRRPVVVVDCN
ncbi:hypothetical protein A2U01_0076392, partial [Trifolium medium]|nr:hypothetical protein [Trifolium medium]